MSNSGSQDNCNTIDDINGNHEEKKNVSGSGMCSNVSFKKLGYDRTMTDHTPRYFANMVETLPQFDPVDGNMDVFQFTDKMEELGTLYDWDEVAIVHYALARLKGNAKLWQESIQKSPTSWVEWKFLLIENFPVLQSSIKLTLDAQSYKRQFNQNIVDYFYKKLSLCNKARMHDDEIMEWIVRGLSNDRFRDYLGPLSRYNKTSDLLCELVKASEYIDRKPPPNRELNFKNESRKSEQNYGNTNLRCFKCREKGHAASRCPNKDVIKSKCFKCQMEGHYAKSCPGIQSKSSNVKVEANKKVNQVKIDTHAKYIKKCLIGGETIDCYVDMGSGATLLRKSDAHKLKLAYVKKNLPSVTGYGEGKVCPIGVLTSILTIDGIEAEVEIFVVPDFAQNIPLLVGHQFTEQQHIKIVSDSSGLKVFSNDSDLEKLFDEKVSLYAEEDMVIPKNYVGNVKVVTALTNKELSIEGGIRENGELIPRCIIKSNAEGKAILPILNWTEGDLVIKNKSKITRGEVFTDQRVNHILSAANEQQHKKYPEIITKEMVNSELTGENLDKLLVLLNKYRNVIALNIFQVGCTNRTEMKITLHDEIPVVYRPYRLAQVERDKVSGIINELKIADIVEDSISPYASPIVLVRKKNGDVRMCVDYRALNRKTIKDHFPLPLIDDQIDRLQGNEWFSTLDLASGYYQVPVEPLSREKTAFVTPDGHYQFKRMPFGLCNSPAVFQRLINNVLGSLRYSIAMAYLDDVIIPSVSIEEGLERLEIVLLAIIDAGLTLNLEKCNFFYKKIEYLGFEISINGIEPGSRKIDGVRNFPVPSDVRGVRSFVGLASYFRRFVQNFAVIVRPLTDLLKQDVKFTWDKEQINAFETIKRKLTEKPVLALYKPGAKVEVHTDASSVGVGAILYQQQDNGEYKPISFYSRKCSKEESKYSSVELEALAIVVGLEKFRIYLIGKPFIIKTDCNSLKLIANKRDLNPRIARWFMRISEFDFRIEYIQGRVNQVADALSRNPSNDALSENDGESKISLGIMINTDWVAALQRTDDDIVKVRDKLEEGDETTHQKFTLYNSRVYKYTKNKWRLFVPDCLRFDVVRDAHESVAHMGIDKTLAKIKTCYYFPKLREFVTKYLNRCINCIYYKTVSGKKPGFLHPLEKGTEPFVTIHIDHVGPYVTTKNKNKYVAVITDGYSKYVVLGAMIDVGSKKTIMFIKLYMSHYGRPLKIISDQGSAFTSELFKKFTEEYCITHVKVASGSARSNGQVEIVNKTITTSLACISDGTECLNWDEKLLDLQLSINNTVHRVTRKTPSEIIFKYKPILFKDNPLTIELTKLNKELNPEGDNDNDNIPELLENNRTIIKTQFDKKRRAAPELSKGDIVMIRSEPPASGESRKLLPKYRGPYEVVKSIGNDRYLIQDIKGESQSSRVYKGILPIDRLKIIKHKDQLM